MLFFYKRKLALEILKLKSPILFLAVSMAGTKLAITICDKPVGVANVGLEL